MRGGIREYWTHILHLGCLLAPLRSLAVSPGRQRRGGGCRGGVYFTRHFPVNLGSPWLIMQPLNLIRQISSLPWKGNGRQSLPLSPLLGPGKLAEKLPLVAQAPGVGSGQEKLTPLCSSFVWPVGPIPWSQPRGTGISVTHPSFRRGLCQGLARGRETSVGVQKAGTSSDLGPAGTEEGQAIELGWESPAHS